MIHYDLLCTVHVEKCSVHLWMCICNANDATPPTRCNAMRCSTMQCNAMQRQATQSNVMQCDVCMNASINVSIYIYHIFPGMVLHCAVLCSAVQCNIVCHALNIVCLVLYVVSCTSFILCIVCRVCHGCKNTQCM